MTTLLDRLHARVGDLWWYSAMLFIACRLGDVIQAFIGLWLVPKYVGPNELGAVLPLQQLSSFFTVPLAIVAVVFSKYVNTYATRGERGKVKSFIHDVIIVSAALMLVCIAAAYWLIPHFYSRLNIAAGSLTVLVLASGFVGNISNLFGSSLQGLKKFKTMTVQSLISAPIRLVTLLIAMPFRPLSGYLLGQTTPAASCSILSALSIRKDLNNTPIDTSWRKDIPEIWHYLWPTAIYLILSSCWSTVCATIYRQRLPEVESSAYYMLSRFSEIASYIGGSMTVVLIPLASEAHEKGNDNTRVLRQTIIATLITTIVLALIFALTGKMLFTLTETWKTYADYAWLLPYLTLLIGIATASGTIISYEMACRRFGVTAFIITFNVIWTTLLVSFTGYEFFRGKLPDALVDWMGSLHIARLSTLTFISIAACTFQLAIQILMFNHAKHQAKHE